MKPQDVRLGYLLIASPVSNTYIGGLMVVDGRGLPVEFRYTEPIQPTKIQQILYGAVLGRYIKTEVILETLLKSLESKPHMLIVSDDSLMLKDIPSRDFDVVRLTETKSAPLKDGIGCVEKMSNYEYLLQLTAEGSPLRIQLAGDANETGPGGPKSLPDKSNTDDITTSSTYGLLLEVGRTTDILEPGKRVEKALGALCQEAGLKSAAG